MPLKNKDSLSFGKKRFGPVYLTKEQLVEFLNSLRDSHNIDISINTDTHTFVNMKDIEDHSYLLDGFFRINLHNHVVSLRKFESVVLHKMDESDELNEIIFNKVSYWLREHESKTDRFLGSLGWLVVSWLWIIMMILVQVYDIEPKRTLILILSSVGLPASLVYIVKFFRSGAIKSSTRSNFFIRKKDDLVLAGFTFLLGILAAKLFGV